MHIEILTPEKTLFQGEAISITLPGFSGTFELLENHAPIIAALQEGVINIKGNKNATAIAIEDGFVECLQNRVIVLVGSGEVQA